MRLEFSTRTGVMVVCAMAVAITAAGCSHDGSDASSPREGASLESSDSTRTPEATSKYRQTQAPGVEPSVVPHVAMMQGSRVRFYGAPSLEEFARTEFISDVVAGTITRTEAKVVGEATDVYTLVTIMLDSARSGATGSMVVRETGGVVKLKQVMGDFEGHVSPEVLGKEDPDSLISYQMADTPLPEVGAKVLVFVSGTDADPGGPFVAARLVGDGSGSFRWPGEAPNPEWSQGVTQPEAATLTAR